MKGRWLEISLWSAILAALASGIVALRRPMGDGGATATPLAIIAAAPPRPSTDSLADALDVITAGNLFRLDREPADTSSAVVITSAFTPRPPSTKPALILRGLLGGPPWDALIDGVPGHDGSLVLRTGQTLAGLTVRAIRRDTVLVSGYDTTWKLTLARF